MITELTQEQIDKFPAYVKKYTAIGLSTERCDREKGNAAINKAYRLAGLEEPKTIIWLDSPLGIALAHHAVERSLNIGSVLKNVPMSGWLDSGTLVMNSVSQHVEQNIGNSMTAEIFHLVSCGVGDSIRNSILVSAWAPIRESVLEAVGVSVRASVSNLIMGFALDCMKPSVNESVRESIWDSSQASIGNIFFAQHSIHMNAYFSFYRDELGLIDQTDKYQGIFDVNESVGFLSPYENICFACDRHNVLNRDDRGRLHSTDSAAVEYPDGFSVYAIHGVRVPEHVIENPEKITVKEIEEQDNQEVRRVMMEKFGHERYLAESGAQLVHEDTCGKLYKREIDGDDELFSMVRVVNSTPEPDGTTKIYFLQVPPTCKTAREAVAWTFGFEESEYNPQVET